MVRNPRVLLVEDSPPLARLYLGYLKGQPCETAHAATGRAALDAIAAAPPEVILLDLMLPDMDGLDILRRVAAQGLPCAVIVLTAHGSIDIAVAAMRGGAYDFLVKPVAADRLLTTLRNALERQRLARDAATEGETAERDRYCGFIGGSRAMQAVYRTIDAAAPSRATVFISGESGTGKELCAEAIHARSPRRDRPFVALNCAAIPKELMESEIFGHIRGAFTGAVAERAGAAARADGGTLFLDEICDLPLDLQTKLLRFVQTGLVQRVGGGAPEPVDVRIVCATNREPLAEVAAGRFREDLYYRLHVIPIRMPPLRERAGDVLDIARHLLAQYAREEAKPFVRFAPEAEAALRAHAWPGNVRQLQNAVRHVVVLHGGEVATAAMLPPLDRADAAAPPDDPAVRPLRQVEKEAIERAVDRCGGDVPKAAALLGISPSTIYRKRAAWRTGPDGVTPPGPSRPAAARGTPGRRGADY